MCGLRSNRGLIQLVASPEIDLSSREESLLHLFLETTKRLSTRDLVEEFCAFRVWPLAKDWKLEVKTSESGLRCLAVEDHTGGVSFDIGFILLFILTALVFGTVAPITEAARAAEVLLGPYTGDEHARRGVVVREPRLNRAYDGSVVLPERADPDEGKRKRARAAEVEVAGPIAAPPLRSVRPREDAGASRSLDPFEGRGTGELPEGVTIRVARSGLSSGSPPNEGCSGTKGGGVGNFGRTMSQVNRAVGTINLTGLVSSESSVEAESSSADEVDIEGDGDEPAALGAAGELFCSTSNRRAGL